MVTALRTSATHPLRIATIIPRDGAGRIGVTLCPGKRQAGAMTGAWARQLGADLAAIKDWGASVVVSLVTRDELCALRVEDLGPRIVEAGMEWIHLPIVDQDIPDERFESEWPGVAARLRRILDGGGGVLIHCKGGLGRAGTVASLLLVECGEGPAMALCKVREVRPGSVETDEQEAYVIAHAVALQSERTSQGG